MKKTTFTITILVLAILLAACNRPYYSPTIQLCRLNLEIFTGYGAGGPTLFVGKVDLGSSTSSHFRGEFVEENGAVHPSVFSFDGSSVHFMITMEQGEIFGSGMMENSLYTCSGRGGGTLSGPAVGDIGDWRGEWIGEEIPNPQPPPTPAPSSVFESPLISLVLVFLLTIAVLSFTGFLKIVKPSSHSKRPSTVTLRRSNQQVSFAGGKKQPLVEYQASYFTGDMLFDLSIDIKQSERYLGECGVSAINQLDKTPGLATGFEVWLFDPASAETATKSTLSDYCFHNAEHSEAGQVFLLKPQVSLQLETRNLTARASIMELEYENGSLHPNSIIRKAVIKIEAWENADSNWQ